MHVPRPRLCTTAIAGLVGLLFLASAANAAAPSKTQYRTTAATFHVYVKMGSGFAHDPKFPSELPNPVEPEGGSWVLINTTVMPCETQSGAALNLVGESTIIWTWKALN